MRSPRLEYGGAAALPFSFVCCSCFLYMSSAVAFFALKDPSNLLVSRVHLDVADNLATAHQQ